MRKRIPFLIITFLLLLTGCHKEENESPQKHIEVSALYQVGSNQQKFTDVGARIYIYYNLEDVDIYRYTYEGEGVFKRGDEVLLPLQNAILEENPTVFVPEYYDCQVIILIESNYYEGQMTFYTSSKYWAQYPGEMSFQMTFRYINLED